MTSLEPSVESCAPQQKLNSWLTGECTLPVPPSVFRKLMDLGKNADANPSDYSDVITTSTSLTSRVLSAVNSSWFGVRHEVKNVTQAVNLLGMVSVRMLALTYCMAAIHERIQLPKSVLEQYWMASLVKAGAGNYLAEQLEPSIADEAFLAGLMQDLALPIMHECCPDLYEPLRHNVVSHKELMQREQEVFGLDHGRASAEMGRTLGLGERLCQIMQCHHDLDALAHASPTPVQAQATYFASLFPHWLRTWHGSEAASAAELIQQTLGDRIESVDQALGDIQEQFAELAGFVRPCGANEVDLPNLLREATGEIADTSVALVGKSRPSCPAPSRPTGTCLRQAPKPCDCKS